MLTRCAKQWALLKRLKAVGGGVCLCLLLLVCLPCHVVNAQDQSLKKPKKTELKVRSIAPQSRNGTPLWVEISVKRNDPEILQGALLLEFFAGNQKITQLTTQQVVIHGGEQTYRFTLPALELDADSPVGWINMRATLLAESKKIDLGQQKLFVPRSDRRNTVLAIAGQGFSQFSLDLVDALTFSNYLPKVKESSVSSVMRSGQLSNFGVFALRLEPNEFPTEALGWTQFNVALLMDDGYAALGLRQLRALSTWIKAGGTACIIANSSLTSDHVDLFNDTVDGGGVQNRFTFSREQGLQISAEKPQGAVSFWRAGLGRLVVIQSSVGAPAIDESTRREIATYLWGARKDQAQAIQATGQWEILPQQFSSHGYTSNNYGLKMNAEKMLYQPLGMENAPALRAYLMPSDSRVIPFTVVVGILVLFILTIGPGDYYLLGLIRKRNWTWLLFPILAISFTVATVVVANELRGREDRRLAIEIHDVGDRGKIVKQTRLELVLLASRHSVKADVSAGLFTPIDTNRLGNSHFEDDPASMIYEGRLPSTFQATQTLKQWVGRIHRETYLGPPAISELVSPDSQSRFRWDAVSEQLLIGGGDSIKEALLGDASFEGAIVLVTARDNPLQQSATVMIYNSLEASPDNFVTPSLVKLLSELTARPRVGCFSVVSRMAPTGGPMLEDLAMLDTTDSRQRVLVVIEKRGLDLIVHRRHYSPLSGGR